LTVTGVQTCALPISYANQLHRGITRGHGGTNSRFPSVLVRHFFSCSEGPGHTNRDLHYPWPGAWRLRSSRVTTSIDRKLHPRDTLDFSASRGGPKVRSSTKRNRAPCYQKLRSIIRDCTSSGLICAGCKGRHQLRCCTRKSYR